MIFVMRRLISVDELSCRLWFAMQKVLARFIEWKLELAVQKTGFICFCRVGPPCFNEFHPSRCRCSLVQLIPGSSVCALFCSPCVFYGEAEDGCCGGTWCALGYGCPGLGAEGSAALGSGSRGSTDVVMVSSAHSWVLRASPPVHSARSFSTEPFSIKNPSHLKWLVFSETDQIRGWPGSCWSSPVPQWRGVSVQPPHTGQWYADLFQPGKLKWFFWAWLCVGLCSFALPNRALLSGRCPLKPQPTMRDADHWE